MKKVNNKKRVRNVNILPCAKHGCQLEYSPERSQPEFSVWICTRKTCDAFIVEHEDAPAGG